MNFSIAGIRCGAADKVIHSFCVFFWLRLSWGISAIVFQQGRIWTLAYAAATVLVYERGERGEGCPLLSTPSSVCSTLTLNLNFGLAHLHNVCNS